MGVAPLPHVVYVVEGVTKHRAALRIDAERVATVGAALELFRQPAAAAIAAGRLEPGARDAFHEVGECLFEVASDGTLGPLQPRLGLVHGHERVTVDAPMLYERRALPGGGEVMLAELVIDRRACGYNRDWAAYHRRKLAQSGDEVERFVLEAAAARLGPDAAERAWARRSEADREALLRAAAERVFAAPFELYSRFVGRRRLIKDGISTLRAVVGGHGGACSEKAQAVRLLCDALAAPATYVISGPETRGEVPERELRTILETFEAAYSTKTQAFWAHLAVLAELGGREVLVDAAAGNIPFLWVDGEALGAMLDRRGRDRVGVPHRYVVGEDVLFYHRVAQDIPERLLYALEVGWADPHIDLVQALDDELGLMTMPDMWLGAIAWRDDEERRTLHDWYREKWVEPGLVRGVVIAPDLTTAEGPIARELRARYRAAAAAASEGRAYMEDRLEEANPGARYRVDLVAVGRHERVAGEGESARPGPRGAPVIAP
jgi:hypothetical protein